METIQDDAKLANIGVRLLVIVFNFTVTPKCCPSVLERQRVTNYGINYYQRRTFRPNSYSLYQQSAEMK
jgi:hypothetical protein